MTIPVKKLIIMNILDILRRYSDEDHRLSQKDIVDILKTEYNMTVERKTIRRNILNLMDCGYEIEYSESVRMVPNSKTGELEESYIWTDFYLVRDFSDSELRLLPDRSFVLRIEIQDNLYYGVCNWDDSIKTNPHGITDPVRQIVLRASGSREHKKWTDAFYWWEYLNSTSGSIDFRHCNAAYEDLYDDELHQSIVERIAAEIKSFFVTWPNKMD